jgi:hypothetical protein
VLKSEVAFAQNNKLIRTPVDVESWIDPEPLDAALHDLKSTAYWPVRTFT